MYFRCQATSSIFVGTLPGFLLRTGLGTQAWVDCFVVRQLQKHSVYLVFKTDRRCSIRWGWNLHIFSVWREHFNQECGKSRVKTKLDVVLQSTLTFGNNLGLVS